MILEGKKINFLGDSITFGSGATKECEFGYVPVFARQSGVAVCRNYGIGGTRIARQKTPSQNPVCDKDYCSRVAGMDADADIVVVFGGTNDFGHGDAKMGSFEDRTPDTFYGACHTLMSDLIAKYIGKPIVVLTPLHRITEDVPNMNGYVLSDYVKVLKEVAQYYALPVLDLYAMSGIQPRVPAVKETLCPDGLHPNNAGHQILADRVENFLRSL